MDAMESRKFLELHARSQDCSLSRKSGWQQRSSSAARCSFEASPTSRRVDRGYDATNVLTF